MPLAEFISLKSEVAAFANPKSSTGRLDILTRLIADGATHFDQVEDGYKGQLYIEIAPRSFSVVVKSGTRSGCWRTHAYSNPLNTATSSLPERSWSVISA